MGKLLTENFDQYVMTHDEQLSKAVERLCTNEYKGLVIVEDMLNRRPVGVFTRRDMVKCSHVFGMRDVSICEYMNKNFDSSVTEISAEDKNSAHALIPILDKVGTLQAIYFPQNNEKRSHHACSVVINAGGKGTRLYPYTENIPKPLVRVVHDKAMVEIIMDKFHKYAMSDFHMIVNHKKEMIEEYFASKRFPYSVRFYEEKTPLGTGGGLYYLKDQIQETFFFSNCDIILLENCDEVYEYHKEAGKIATMIVSLKPIYVPYGVIQTDENQNIKASVEKPTYMTLVNTGIYILEPEIFNYIRENENIGFPDVLERVKADGHGIGVYPITADRWLDMGQIEELEYAKKVLEQRLNG